MRRSIIALIGAGGELVRFFGLMALARVFLGSAGGKSSLDLFQFAAAPQLLFAGGFFFLWLDPGRYDVFRPLLAAGKALCFLSLAALTVRFIVYFRQDVFVAGDPAAVLTAMLSFLLWDAAAGCVLIVSLRKFPGLPDGPKEGPADNLPETVEIE